MTIDFRRFSLGKTQVTINRFETVESSPGVYTKNQTDTILAWASVQPYDTVDPAQIFEPQAGQWVDEVYWMFIDQVIFMNNNQETNETADIIVADGVSYRPVRVQKWLHLSNEHYKVLLQRFDGD